MRIGVSGPGGTGKTTLATALSSAMRLPLVAEGVREWLAREQFAGPWSLSCEDQIRLQRHAISYKIALESAAPAFISDRTTVDAVTLLTLRLELLARPVPELLCAEALLHAGSTYDAVVLLTRQMAPVIPQKERIDAALIMRESELTRSLYESLGTPIICVPALAPHQLAPFVESALRRLLQKRA